MNKLFKAALMLTLVLLFSVGIMGQSISVNQVDHIQASDGNGGYGGGFQIADGGNGYGGGG